MQLEKTTNNTYYFKVFYEDLKTRELKRKHSSGYKGKKEATRACNEYLGLHKTLSDFKEDAFVFVRKGNHTMPLAYTTIENRKRLAV